ncbi:hypothetical protein [Cylindrospermopsis raciborskii]|uniref:hypothetical protein n=1 Tax=Cylindrospermopsis raciborskii TaxID=77022 RepID=UPI0038D0FD78
MSYSNFSLDKIEDQLGINIQECPYILKDVQPQPVSDRLKDTLEYNLPLALEIGTEKARSEMIIAPILIEVRRTLGSEISLFSGREFNIDYKLGLTGFCDFLVSRSPSQLIIKAPAVIIVEAKNDNIQSGLGQCIAQMYAAQIFNQSHNASINAVYGSVTTGTNWKFLQLVDKVVSVDVNEYFLNDLSLILGLLRAFITGL